MKVCWLVFSRQLFVLGLQELLLAALESEGLSGRTLRKLPFLAYANLIYAAKCSPLQFAAALNQAVIREKQERSLLSNAKAA